MDIISEMLIKIKNAQAVFHPSVEISFSNLKFEIAKILEQEGFVGKVEKKKKNHPTIEIILKYNDKTPAISGIKRISKQGQRIYQPFDKIRKVKEGYGIAIISTSRGGLMTGKEARRQKTGGELIAEIW